MTTYALTVFPAPDALTALTVVADAAPPGQCWLLFDALGGPYDLPTFPASLLIQVHYGSSVGTATSTQLLNIPATALVNVQGRVGSLANRNWGYLLDKDEADAIVGGTATGQWVSARVVRGDTQSSAWVTGSPALSFGSSTATNGVPTGGTTGQALVKVDATDYNTTWTTLPVTSPAGSNTYIQYNSSGVFGASSLFTFSSNVLTVNSVSIGRRLASTKHNIYYGDPAFGSLTTGLGNTSITDAGAFTNITTGSGNTAVGYGAGVNSGTSNSYNTAIGYNSLATLSSGGDSNTALGANALSGVTSGANNTGLGANAGSSITTGSNNVVIGGATGSTALANTVLISDGAGNIFITSTSTGTALSSNLVLPKTSGVGIKVDTSTPTYPWADLLCQVSVRGTAATDPSWNVFKGVMRAYQFTVNDFVWTFVHLPHDFLPGSDFYFHVHWAHSDPSITSGGVTWEFITSYAKGHNQAAFSAEKTVTVTQTASTTQFQHMIAEAQISTPGGSATLIDSSLLEPDGIILIRTRLTGNTMNGGPEPFVFMMDAHYQSTGVGTKQKSPNFYV